MSSADERRLARRELLKARRKAGVPWKPKAKASPRKAQPKRPRRVTSTRQKPRLKVYGPPAPVGRPRSLTPAKENAISTEISALQRPSEIAERHGVSTTQVYRVARNLGTPVRRGEILRLARAERVQILKGLGLTRGDIVRLALPDGTPSADPRYKSEYMKVSRDLEVPTRFSGWHWKDLPQVAFTSQSGEGVSVT